MVAAMCEGSSVAHDAPQAVPRGPGAKSTPSQSGDLLAGMRTHTALPLATDPVYITELALSRRTTLSRTTLQTMCRKGGGPPFAKLGHRIVYRLADVERWIAARTQMPPDDPAGGGVLP